MTELQKEIVQEVMELNGISETEAIDRVLMVEKAINEVLENGGGLEDAIDIVQDCLGLDASYVFPIIGPG